MLKFCGTFRSRAYDLSRHQTPVRGTAERTSPHPTGNRAQSFSRLPRLTDSVGTRPRLSHVPIRCPPSAPCPSVHARWRDWAGLCGEDEWFAHTLGFMRWPGHVGDRRRPAHGHRTARPTSEAVLLRPPLNVPCALSSLSRLGCGRGRRCPWAGCPHVVSSWTPSSPSSLSLAASRRAAGGARACLWPDQASECLPRTFVPMVASSVAEAVRTELQSCP